jgi:FKBP-type peptidyl-prolyl cis-trans isomerase SlpA
VNTIQEGSFLTLHYRLAGPDGADVINTFADKPATLSLGTGQLAPGHGARPAGPGPRARTTFALAAGEAFGERNPQMLQRVKRSLLLSWATRRRVPRGRRGAVPHARRQRPVRRRGA